MKPFQEKMSITAMAVATVLLAAGCRSTKTYSYQPTPAPVVSSSGSTSTTTTAMGGAGTATGMQTGGGASTAQPSGATISSAGETNLVIPLQKETVSVGTKQVPAGSVHLQKTVKTETVSQPVQIRKESISVDRQDTSAQPPSTASTGGDLGTPFKEGELTINLTQEEPFVQKQVVPAGSVVVKKQVTTEPVNIQEQVRHEEITANSTGTTNNVAISGNLTSANEAQGAAPSATGQSTGAGASKEPVTQPSELSTSADPSMLAGRPVNFSNAKVKDVAGDNLVTLSTDTGSPIYVHTSEPTSGLKAGQTVNLTGTIKAVPQTASDLGWDSTSTQKVQGQPIYIDAIRITPANQ